MPLIGTFINAGACGLICRASCTCKYCGKPGQPRKRMCMNCRDRMPYARPRRSVITRNYFMLGVSLTDSARSKVRATWVRMQVRLGHLLLYHEGNELIAKKGVAGLLGEA